ncbi:MAG: hypothetical protein R3F34_12630 [Planctomycetota bacterium]
MPNPSNDQGKARTRSQGAQLRKLACEKIPTRVMGLKLGRSVASVHGRANALGQSLKPTNLNPYDQWNRWLLGMPSATLIREPLFCMTGAS